MHAPQSGKRARCDSCQRHELESLNATLTLHKPALGCASDVGRLLEISQPLVERRDENEEQAEARTQRLAAAVKEVRVSRMLGCYIFTKKMELRTSSMQLLECLGEDIAREGIVDTPRRAAEALLFWCDACT